jgi:hypothetical protein
LKQVKRNTQKWEGSIKKLLWAWVLYWTSPYFGSALRLIVRDSLQFQGSRDPYRVRGVTVTSPATLEAVLEVLGALGRMEYGSVGSTRLRRSSG